ncbi:MAG: hypothetical protein Q8Q42_04425 [Nanoarchaeota archaeon]|nr:hypothetical protein [Nanoarchaeota archaeon]
MEEPQRKIKLGDIAEKIMYSPSHPEVLPQIRNKPVLENLEGIAETEKISEKTDKEGYSLNMVRRRNYHIRERIIHKKRYH